jgi:hypothetical protein
MTGAARGGGNEQDETGEVLGWKWVKNHFQKVDYLSEISNA